MSIPTIIAQAGEDAARELLADVEDPGQVTDHYRSALLAYDDYARNGAVPEAMTAEGMAAFVAAFTDIIPEEGQLWN